MNRAPQRQNRGAVHAWTQYAPVSMRAIMMWSSGNPRPPRSFPLREKRQDVLFFLALAWVRNVECALGLGGFLGAAPIYSNGVAGRRRHHPARRGGGRSL